MAQLRTPFSPTPCDIADGATAPEIVTRDGSYTWVPLIRCIAGFPVELFESAVAQLIHHPEYNSTLILRSETIFETTEEPDIPSSIPALHGLRPTRVVHRKLLPRRPGRDTSLEQYCTLFAASADAAGIPSVLLLTPIVTPESPLPYYHPRVSHLAFRILAGDLPMLQIEVVPLPDTPLDMGSRLYRTCLSLLETLHRYGWGAMVNYKKRVVHDCIVPREIYQDLYLVMRERHKHIVNEWKEVTDPLKHVFEDIGIATFLMLLWKDMYGPKTAPLGIEAIADEPWKTWPRPPTGFLDLGCGNGLLTHILTAEGYEGHGIDLRARTSWTSYPEATQRHLHVTALDPTTSQTDDPYLMPGVFLIGNHADELTPWVPVLATVHSASGYLSIPCCAWTFDSRYERSRNRPFPIPLPLDEFTETLNLGGDGSNSSAYSMYRIWLASLSFHCGWKIETETLRIPSTRNWALIGKERSSQTEEERMSSRYHVDEIIKNVRERGIFKTRKPEGKAGDH